MKSYIKKSLISAAAIITLSMAANDVSAREDITVYYNARELSFDSAKPIIEKGRTLIPMRKIFEELGATVDWDHSTKTITANKDGKTIKLKIGSRTVNVNSLSGLSYNQTIVVAPKIYNAETMVPLRVVSESLGAKVEWNDEHRVINIENDKEQNNDIHGVSYSLVKNENDSHAHVEVFDLLINGKRIGSIFDYDDYHMLILHYHDNKQDLGFAWEVVSERGFNMPKDEFMSMEIKGKLMEGTAPTYEYNGMTYVSYLRGGPGDWKLEWYK